jgi:hypothetical protein
MSRAYLDAQVRLGIGGPLAQDSCRRGVARIAGEEDAVEVVVGEAELDELAGIGGGDSLPPVQRQTLS